MKGFCTQYFFTAWAWNLLGLSFALNGAITLLVYYGYKELMTSSFMLWYLRISIIIFEISAPTAMLVSFVVRYALWPNALKGNGSNELKSFLSIVKHNVNIISVMVEVCLLGGIPIRGTDIVVAPLFGCTYIIFTWYMIHNWVPSGEPIFLYFFFDTTIRKKLITLVIVILSLTLMLFFGIFIVFDDIMLYMGGGLTVHFGLVVGVSSLVCRFFD